MFPLLVPVMKKCSLAGVGSKAELLSSWPGCKRGWSWESHMSSSDLKTYEAVPTRTHHLPVVPSWGQAFNSGPLEDIPNLSYSMI